MIHKILMIICMKIRLFVFKKGHRFSVLKTCFDTVTFVMVFFLLKTKSFYGYRHDKPLGMLEERSKNSYITRPQLLIYEFFSCSIVVYRPISDTIETSGLWQ